MQLSGCCWGCQSAKNAKNVIKWLLGLSKNSIRDRNFILTPGAGQHETQKSRFFLVVGHMKNSTQRPLHFCPKKATFFDLMTEGTSMSKIIIL